MEFKIRIDKEAKYIIAHINEIPDAVKFIKKNDCNGLQIGGIIGDIEIIPDFNIFEELSDKLIWLSLSMHQRAPKIDHFEDIYLLKKLRYLYLNDKEKFKIDLSKFDNLKYLGAEYWTGINNIDKAKKLETMVLSKYVKKDLCEFSPLANLATLHLYSSKIENLDCIEKLSNLQELRLARNQQLTDISALFDNKNLSVLTIEKCKHITEASLFNKKLNISEFYIDEIDSLSFIKHMPKLEKLTFLDCKDGNLEILLQAPNLKYVHFFPFKKHYSHTKDEIDQLLKNRKK